MYLFEPCFSLGMCPVWGLQDPVVALFSASSGPSMLFSLVAAPNYIPTKSGLENSPDSPMRSPTSPCLLDHIDTCTCMHTCAHSWGHCAHTCTSTHVHTGPPQLSKRGRKGQSSPDSPPHHPTSPPWIFLIILTSVRQSQDSKCNSK